MLTAWITSAQRSRTGLRGVTRRRLIAAGGCTALVLGPACTDALGSRGQTGGRVLWKVPTAVGLPLSPAFDGQTVFHVSGDQQLYAIDGKTGAVRWKVPTGEAPRLLTPGNNIAIAGDVVVVGGVDIYAFDRRSGAPLWKYVAPDLDETGTRRLTTDGETIYAASYRGRAYAIDARTGNARWVADLTGGDTSVSSFDPVVADGIVYVGTKQFVNPPVGSFWALDAVTGRVRWTYAFQAEYPGQGSGCLGGAEIYEGAVMVPIEDGRIFAFDRSTGAIRWTAARVHSLPGPIGTGGTYDDTRQLAMAGDNLLATSLTGIVVALDAATGRERWRSQGIRASVVDKPAASSSTAYVNHGVVVAYDLRTGAVRWLYPREEDVQDQSDSFMGTPIPNGDRVYVAGAEGLFALQK